MTEPATLHSLDSEASVLGGIFLRPEVIGALSLDVFDFFHPKHQAVFQAMRNLEARTTPIDPVTVEAELARMGKVEAVGGLGFLSELTLRVPSRENVLHYAQEVTRKARRRTAIRKVSDLLGRLQKHDDADDESSISECAHELLRLDMGGQDPTKSLGDLMLAEIQAIEHDIHAADRGEWVAGMPTGIARLDRNTGGLPIGLTSVVMGETGSGKSTLAGSFARAAYREAGDVPILASYEDGPTSFARRRLAHESGVPTWKIGARRFEGDEALRVVRAGIAAQATARERIAFNGGDIDDLCSMVRQMRAKGPPAGAKSIGRLLIVDYIQAMPMPNKRWIQSRTEGLTELSQRLERLAAMENIAVVIFAQVNEDPEKRGGVIRLRDCADGKGPVKGCKLALGIYRPHMYDERADPLLGKLIVLKNNQGGQVGKTVDVRLSLATHTIADVEEP